MISPLVYSILSSIHGAVVFTWPADLLLHWAKLLGLA